jgi:hypothetical protein
MAGQTGNYPPALMERVVEFLIPPASREAVAGDLREMYASPRQYGLAALQTLPLIVASQARRNANLPLLGLQGIFLFACLVSLGLPLIEGGWLTLLAVLVLLLRDAYQPVKCPATGVAILQAQAVSMLATLYIFSTTDGSHAHNSQWSVLFIAGVLPFSMPVMSILRASLILRRERQEYLPDADMALGDMARDYQQFEQRMRRANRLEIAALFLSMAAGAGFMIYFAPSMAMAGWALLCLFALAAARLLLRGTAPALPLGVDFATLRTLYKHELARQNQIRRFMWWLWFAPVLALLVAMIGRGMRADQPLLTVLGTALMVLAGFWIATFNRERGGFVSEKIGVLALMRERRTP